LNTFSIDGLNKYYKYQQISSPGTEAESNCDSPIKSEKSPYYERIQQAPKEMKMAHKKAGVILEKGKKIRLQKSIYSNRACTIFFPYPPSCNLKRDSVRTLEIESCSNSESRGNGASTADTGSVSGFGTGDTEPEQPVKLMKNYTQNELNCLSATGLSPNSNFKLKFKISDHVYTYNCVVNALKAAGFTQTNGKEWNLLWSAPLKAENLRNFNQFQRCNHFPAAWQLGRKDNLWRNISRFVFIF
jgi:hypothetical protein